MTSEYDYFVLRLQRPHPDRPRELGGVVERLGTGETRVFGNGEELLRLLGVWSPARSKMQGEGSSGNTAEV